MFDLVNSFAIAAIYFFMGWRFYTRILPAMDPHVGRSGRSIMIWLFATALMLFAAARIGSALDETSSPTMYNLGHYALIGFSFLFYRRMLRRTDGGARWANDGECR